MQFKSLLLVAAAATSVLAAPAPAPDLLGLINGILSGFPLGNGNCLNDQQATYIVNQFKSILTNPNRKAAATTANALLDAGYTETSDSINVLDGTPVSIFFASELRAPTNAVTGGTSQLQQQASLHLRSDWRTCHWFHD